MLARIKSWFGDSPATIAVIVAALLLLILAIGGLGAIDRGLPKPKPSSSNTNPVSPFRGTLDNTSPTR